MVTNLPEAAKAQWRRVVAAATPEQKLEELRKFYSMIPKHKGTKNLVKQVKRQIARLTEEIEERRRRKYAVHVTRWEEAKHGFARAAIISEDRQLAEEVFSRLTGREVEGAARWSFEPIYGVVSDGALQMQLSLLPPYGCSDSLDHRIYGYVRSSVDYLLVPGWSLEQVREFVARLAEDGLYVGSGYGEVSIEKMPTGGIRVVGASAVGQEEVAELLRSYRIYNAVVKLSGEVTLSDIEDHILGIRTVKPGLAVVAGDGLEAYRLVRGEVSGGPLSLASKSLVEEVLRGLDLIRVYTKPHGGEVEERPVVLKRGARVIDLAREIHSRLAENFRYAVVIRGGRRIRTSKNFQLEDGDIVTIYA